VTPQVLAGTEYEEALTEALVDAQDRLVACYELASLRVDSLDFEGAAAQILRQTRRLTGCQAAYMEGFDSLSGSSEGNDSALGSWLRAQAPLIGGTQPQAFSQGGRDAAVARVILPNGRSSVVAFARVNHPFRTNDLKLIGAVAATLTAAAERARMHVAAVRAAQVESEHALASQLAQAVLKGDVPRLAGVDVFAACHPARTAGGDFFSCLEVDGRMLVAVGDVAGKGLPAALVMTRVLTSLNAAVARRANAEPDEILAELDRDLYDYLSEVGLFVTIAVAVYDPASRTLSLCNAGHSPVIHARSGSAHPIASSVPPLGVVPGMHAAVVRIDLERGDFLLIGSDGLAEQEAPDGQQFGYSRLSRSVADMHGLTPGVVGKQLLAQVEAFAAGTPASDDRTLLILSQAAS
jgi:serine phosphatase RsbU (regulator of sigma subunit)